MMNGNIYYAVLDGQYILRFTGDVRVNLCSSVSEFFNCLFQRSSLKSIIIDLSDTQGIDSTSLGLLAKISVMSQKLLHRKAVIISKNHDITCILNSMGFDQVFDILDSDQVSEFESRIDSSQFTALTASDAGEVMLDEGCGCEGIYDYVLEAHRYLMEMNDRNKETFKPLVDALEMEQSQVKNSASIERVESTDTEVEDQDSNLPPFEVEYTSPASL